MANSIISGLFKVENSGRSLMIGGLEIQIGTSQNIARNTTTDYNFPRSFKTTCVACIPVCVQLGFGAPSTISVNNWTTAKCQVYQTNTANAAMNIMVIAIGY